MKGTTLLTMDRASTPVEQEKPTASGFVKGIELVEHRARIKAEKRILGEEKRNAARLKSGKRWELLQDFKLAETHLGHGSVRLDHYFVRQALEDAIQHNDWDFLWHLSRWHKTRKPIKPDELSVFVVQNWECCTFASGGWKGLRDLDDTGISLLAASRGIRIDETSKGYAVRDRRLAFRLERNGEPRFTFRKQGGKLVLKRLA